MAKVTVKAIQSFTAYDGEKMVVFNAGTKGEDTHDLPEALAEQYIDAGMAELAKGKAKAAEAPAAEPAADAAP